MPKDTTMPRPKPYRTRPASAGVALYFLNFITPLALTTRPVPGPKRAAEDRPVSRCAYFVLNTCRSGTTELTGAIFILAHPLPPVRPGGSPGPKGDAKEILNAEGLS